MKIRNFIFITLCLLGDIHLSAQSDLRIFKDQNFLDIAKQIVDNVYNYDFAKAEELIESLKPKYGEHPAYIIMKCLSRYQKSVFDIDRDKADPTYYEWLKKAIRLSDEMYDKDSDDDEAIFFELISHSYLALYHNENKNMLSAASEGKRTYKYLKKGYSRKEQNPEFYLSSGLLDYYIEQYPESNPSSKAILWIFPDGDKKRAIKYFRLGADKAVFTSPESLGYLIHVYLKYESNYEEALKVAIEALGKYPNNMFFRARYAEALLGTKEYKLAKIEIDKLLKSDIEFFQLVGHTLNGIYYEEYMKRADIAKNNFKKAQGIGEKNVKVSFDYLSMAYNGLGRYYDSKSNEDKAELFFEKSLDIAEYRLVIKEAKTFLDKY